MKSIHFLFIATLALFTCQIKAQTKADNFVPIDNINDLKAYFRYNPNKDIVISAHRGGMMSGYPENCIESLQKTISMMPTFFEIDFSFTKDSIMVLMHDLTLDRTTTGKGKIQDYTYKELQNFYLKDRDGSVTKYKIPTLNEVLQWGNHKVVFNFDNKYINTKGVDEKTKKASLDYYIKQLKPGGDWSKYHNIMLSVRSIEEALYYWNNGIRNVMFCVEISSQEDFDKYNNSPIPWDYIMAYIRLNVNPNLYGVYKQLHKKGVSTMISITGSSDKIYNKGDRKIAYQQNLLTEPDIIETDYPSEFIDLIKSRKLLHDLKKKQ